MKRKLAFYRGLEGLCNVGATKDTECFMSFCAHPIPQSFKESRAKILTLINPKPVNLDPKP